MVPDDILTHADPVGRICGCMTVVELCLLAEDIVVDGKVAHLVRRPTRPRRQELLSRSLNSPRLSNVQRPAIEKGVKFPSDAVRRVVADFAARGRDALCGEGHEGRLPRCAP